MNQTASPPPLPIPDIPAAPTARLTARREFIEAREPGYRAEEEKAITAELLRRRRVQGL